jgi:hypothetical protein
MRFNFDENIDRRNTNSIKYISFPNERYPIGNEYSIMFNNGKVN